jgi:hypothetical protein
MPVEQWLLCGRVADRRTAPSVAHHMPFTVNSIDAVHSVFIATGENGSHDLRRESARHRKIGVAMDEFPLATAAAEGFTHADAHINGRVLTSNPHLGNLESSPEGEIAADILLQDFEVAGATGLERSGVVAVSVGYRVGAGDGLAARAVKRGSAIFRHEIVERGSVTVDVGFGGSGALGEELIEIGICHCGYSWYRIVGSAALAAEDGGRTWTASRPPAIMKPVLY